MTSSVGASGTLFAQIQNGAPFDVFLAADLEYPQQVVARGLGADRSRLTFARGQLAVWTMRTDLDLSDIAAAVRAPSVKKVAIAQPQTAPYGRAAQRVLETVGAWNEVKSKLVTGENLSQTAQFVETGNADLGFVAASIVFSSRASKQGRWRLIDPEQHPGVSLDHGAVLTNRGTANPAAKRYLLFLRGEPAKKILRAAGYVVLE